MVFVGAAAIFVVSAAALVWAGTSLASSGDELAARTGLGGLFVGTLLLAFATSLPEITADVAAAAADAPDLAVADLFGSSMANMAILAIIDLRHRGRVWPVVELGHVRVAAVGIAMTALAAMGLHTPSSARIGWVGLTPILLGVLYAAAIAWLRRVPTLAERRGEALMLQMPVGPDPREPSPGPLRNVIGRFTGAAAATLVAAPVVALSLRELARISGIEQTVVGAIALAVTTSLPELVTALAAIRMGAHDLAVGNLFGSNTANMAVLLLVDLAYLDGPVLSAVDPTQGVAALGAILLMALAVAALVGGTETRIRRLEPDAILLLLAYAGALLAVVLGGLLGEPLG